MKNKLVILLSFSLLTGCYKSEEKISAHKILLTEKENELPKSTLKKPDDILETELLNELPEIKSFTKLTKQINKKNNSFTVQNIEWEKSKTKVNFFYNTSGPGNVWYETYYKCTQQGFWSCKSGYRVDYRFKIKDKKKDEKYIFSHVEGHPKEISKTNKKGKLYTAKRDKLEVQSNTSYTLVWNNIPLLALKHFDIFEEYCTESDSTWNLCDIEIKYFDQEVEEQKEILDFLSTREIDSISSEAIEGLYKKYSKYDDIKEYLSIQILSRIIKRNSIVELHEFNKQYKSHKIPVNKSIDSLYKLAKIKDSVAGYEWFITHYSNTKYAKPALERIHEIMFEKAQKVGTITAYNSFVFSYPTAKQVTQANKIANEKERVIYTNLGLLGFYDTDHKKEKKSRKFLIKAKQIERFPRDNDLRGDRKSGYLIVADRMYKLLQEEFDESDATLRHLESQEFKDFVSDFKYIMKGIRNTLEKVESNTKEMSRYTEKMVTISRNGFTDAKADRAMTAYHEKKKTEWDKFMHLRDKGYQ